MPCYAMPGSNVPRPACALRLYPCEIFLFIFLPSYSSASCWQNDTRDREKFDISTASTLSMSGTYLP